MKKRTIVLLIALLFINISILTSCGKHEHTFDEGRVIQEATCTKEGIKEFKCTECEETKQETINKLEHLYETTIIRSTCKETGLETKVCKLCNDKQEKVLGKLDHTIVIDEVVESTCKETGLTEGSHCSVCKEIIEKQEVIDKLEHNYVDGICTKCNDIDPNYIVPNASEGLEFELNDSKTGYIVTGIGTCTDTDIVIPSTYNGLLVTGIGYGAFLECTELKNITIPNSVTSIGYSAFYDCTSLESITIPSSVTSIGNGAFSRCTSLTNITVDENNSVYDSRENCNAIIKTSTNTLIFGCKNTTIPNSVTSIGQSAFVYCPNLTNITIPNSVTSIGYSAFSDCTSLESITIPSSVTSIGNYAFMGCTSLESITIPNSVTSIGDGAFNCCINLKSVIFEDGSKLTIIEYYAFSKCISLTSIELPNSVTSIGENAFGACTSLTSITIPSSVTSIGEGAFCVCTSLTIYCEAESKPSGWDTNWNNSSCPVVWGYTKNE